MKYQVPKEDGEDVFSPARETVPELVESNHSLLERQDFEVAGRRFQELRASARRKVAAGAGESGSESLRIVVGAHQPGFPGPGIMYKYGVLETLSHHGLSVNFVVDSDTCREVSAKVPYVRRKSMGLKRVVIFPNREALVFEKLPVPPRDRVDSRYGEIAKLLESLREERTLRAFEDFRAVHEKVYAEGESAARVLTDYRRGYYPTPNVYDSFISTISRSDEFLIYACDIVERIEEFQEAYNSSLGEHRRKYRIRSPANPFPDLVGNGALWELPFWGLDRYGRRHKLWAGGPAGRRFVTRGRDSGDVCPARTEAMLSLGVRPRAVCLTMFLRLFAGDLFVHGVGGGNYDRATDEIVRRYYGISPPGYVVCSRTRFLSGRHSGNLSRREEELKEKRRRMRHNPERFAPERDPLADEARRILSACGGKPRARERVRLRELRRRLLRQISPELSSVQRELAEVEEAVRRHAALRRRDLPYFLYPRSEL